MEQLIVSAKTGCSTLLLIDYFVKDNSLLIDSTNAATLPILYSYQSSKIDLRLIEWGSCLRKETQTYF